MKAAVVVFPGSNCDRDIAVALHAAGAEVQMVWHKQDALPSAVDLVALPGGFSYGDYLRCGAIAARSPICAAVRAHADRGGYLLGICNGFQVLTEMRLLPGALLRNAGLHYICRTVELRVEGARSSFLQGFEPGQTIRIPIAHHDGNYFADAETLARLEGEGRIALRYTKNPNGSVGDIAGITDATGRILGMMPHPERAADPGHPSQDGTAFFRAFRETLTLA